jgi:hypothetical protein
MSELSGKSSRKSKGKKIVFSALIVITIALGAVTYILYNDSTKLKTIVFSSDSMLMKVDGKDSMAFTSDPVDYDLFKLTWTSSDTTIATVSDSGIVTGLMVGKVTINVQDKNKVADSFTVEVVDDNCPLSPAVDRASCLDKNRVINLMPDFDGFEKAEKVIDGYTKYVYIAKAGNRYGVPLGEISGYYKEEVTFEGKTVGGIAFIPKIVEKLLADKDGKAIFIPADISEINNMNFVTLSFEAITFKGIEFKDIYLKIDITSNLISVSNPITHSILTNQIRATGNSVFPSYVVNGIAALEYSNKYDILILGNFDNSDIIQNAFSLGHVLTKTSGIFIITLNTEFGPESIKRDEILKVGNAFVFLKDLD